MFGSVNMNSLNLRISTSLHYSQDQLFPYRAACRYLQEGFMHINTEVGKQAATQEQACGGNSDRACVTFYSCRCVNCCLAIIELLPFSFVASKLYTLIRNERGFSPAHRPL